MQKLTVEGLEANPTGASQCRVYNDTLALILKHKGKNTIANFISEAVDLYVSSVHSKSVADRLLAIEESQKKIELSNETSLGLLVNALSKLNLMDDKGGKKK